MKKLILFVILQQYADWEAAYISSAISMLGQGKYDIKTVSLSKESVCSIGGFQVMPDYDLSTMPESYEALILIGGLSWRGENTQKIGELARDCVQKKKLLGGICDAAAFLGTAGVLNHAVHTANDLNDLKQWAKDAYTGEENFIAKQAVCDRNIVTANGTAPLEFAKEILFALHAADEKAITEWYNFHKLGVYTAPMPGAAQK